MAKIEESKSISNVVIVQAAGQSYQEEIQTTRVCIIPGINHSFQRRKNAILSNFEEVRISRDSLEKLYWYRPIRIRWNSWLDQSQKHLAQRCQWIFGIICALSFFSIYHRCFTKRCASLSATWKLISSRSTFWNFSTHFCWSRRRYKSDKSPAQHHSTSMMPQSYRQLWYLMQLVERLPWRAFVRSQERNPRRLASPWVYSTKWIMNER